MLSNWRKSPLVERIQLLRYILPFTIAIVVIIYQLMIARTLADRYGHFVHYSVEIAFYSFFGPVVSWITLVWIEKSILEKEALENQVRTQTQQIANLASASMDAIISLDSHGRIVSWNRGAQRIFGYSAMEINGQQVDRLLLDASQLEERLQRVGLVQNFETKALAHDGRSVMVALTLSRLEDPNKINVPSTLLIMRDITARKEREAILEEERGRISRDLHDGIAQTLYFLALKADMGHEQVIDEPEKAEEALKEIGRETRRVIHEVRRTIFALQPLHWTEHDFLPALRKFIEKFGAQLDLQIELDVSENISQLPEQLEITLFRVVQESLNNIAKHAEANQVKIHLKHNSTPLEVALEIIDNGSGFEIEGNNRQGFGLEQMKRRVEAQGGIFNIERQKSGGSVVTTSLPIPGENHAEN
ncbi:MAG: PAS domain S-box protein [Chloroflexi bacterium]|nr:PAS domain S-box protein [Chloroflexota bacterium]